MSPPVRFLRSSRIVTPTGLFNGAVQIRDGRIAAVTPAIPAGAGVEDLGDLVLMPGLVDTHVHVNEPGRTDWEGFEAATNAAAAGGVTTLIDMPLNSSPVTTSVAALREKLAAASGKMRVDCGFHGGVVPGSEQEIAPLARAGVLGMKAFLIHSGIDDFPAVGEADLRRAMPAIAAAGIPLLVHCEIASPVPGAAPADPASYAGWCASRPPSWECAAIDLLARLAREYSCKVHVVHVSSSDAIPVIGRARAQGVPLTAETCPHYLTFAAEEIPDGDTRFKCAPPIRAGLHRERLWGALGEGLLDFIVSDHSPSPPALKVPGDFQRAWGGIASLQSGLAAVWTGARARGFGVTDLARWMCAGPASFAGLPKGVIAPGRDAAFRSLWGETSRYFIARPGFVSLRLHRAVNDDAPYRWVNVAVWESEAAFRAAHGTEQFRTLVTAPGWSEFPSLPALFEVDTEVG